MSGGMLGALLRQQNQKKAEQAVESHMPDAIIGNQMIEYKFTPRFPAFVAGQTHALEPKHYESKSYLPALYSSPEQVEAESMEDVARESDEPARMNSSADPIPAAPPSASINLGAFLRAAKKHGVTVNVVTRAAEKPESTKEVPPRIKVQHRDSIIPQERELPGPEEADAIARGEEEETLTGYVGRMVADFRNRYGTDLHVPFDRIAAYRKWADQSMVLESLLLDQRLSLAPPESHSTEITRIEDDRDIGTDGNAVEGIDLPVQSGFDALPEPAEDMVDDAGESEESSVGAIDILSAPSIIAGSDFPLDPSQESAIITLARVQCGCLIGAAGTGKTTTTKRLVHVLMYGSAALGIEPLRLKPVDIKKYHERGADKGKKKKTEESAEGTIIPSIAMVAFTGQATQVLKKNMPKEWHRNVMTIHLLLGFAPVKFERADGSEGTRFEPSYTKTNKMPWDVIIVDETSMVAVELWHQLLDASKPGCRFYFIGDLNQLPPPIGAGILGFALSKWPVAELTTVHRQADDTANRIVDTAHRILNGQVPEFDDTAQGPSWRVAGFKLKHSSEDAAAQIVALATQLSKIDYKDGRGPVYDPWRDRIMVAMNGYNPDRPNYVLGQEPLNDALSQVFAGKDNERIIINAKKKIKKFSVGYRVMATKNEPPNQENRVTNGLTGKIISIVPNEKWTGDWDLVGPEKQVRLNRQRRMEEISRHEAMTNGERADSLGETIANFRLKATLAGESKSSDEETEKQGGPCSHVVTVAFDNGGVREYRLNAQVEQLQIAYASTVHKAQGAEMPLAIVVIHHNQKMMLNRELLYTAVTRASQRVLILYTDHGLRIALQSQKISGRTLPEKIRQYQELLGEATGRNMFRTVNVRLFQDESEMVDVTDSDSDDPADMDYEPDEE